MKDQQLQNMSLLLIDQDRYTPYYRHYFYNKEHLNFLGYDKVCFKKRKEKKRKKKTTHTHTHIHTHTHCFKPFPYFSLFLGP